MALYEMRCTNPACGIIEEVMRPMSEAGLPGLCPRCGCLSEQIVSRCAFNMPGFKNGERITEDSLLEGKA